MRREMRGLLAGGLAALLPFCGSDDEERVCDPGKVVECPCPGGGKGVQTCKSSGAGYGDCTGCEGSDGGGAGGSSGGAGEGGGGAGGTSGTGGSSGGTGGTSDGGATCPAGEATDAVTDECDLILQDCPPGRTCSIEPTDGGSYRTVCADLGSGTKQLSDLCDFHSDCAPGLRCTLRKCTRPCCDAVEQQQCGSDGDCDLQINFGNNSAFLKVCTFSPPCTPWANDCPPGPETDCHLGFNSKIACSFPNYSQDAGSTLGQPCQFLNDCEDSQHCSYESSGATMGTCRWLCKVKDDGAPASGTVGGAPGQGGCPSGQTCAAFADPDWLGVCRP